MMENTIAFTIHMNTHDIVGGSYLQCSKPCNRSYDNLKNFQRYLQNEHAETLPTIFRNEMKNFVELKDSVNLKNTASKNANCTNETARSRAEREVEITCNESFKREVEIEQLLSDDTFLYRTFLRAESFLRKIYGDTNLLEKTYNL